MSGQDDARVIARERLARYEAEGDLPGDEQTPPDDVVLAYEVARLTADRERLVAALEAADEVLWEMTRRAFTAPSAFHEKAIQAAHKTRAALTPQAEAER